MFTKKFALSILASIFSSSALAAGLGVLSPTANSNVANSFSLTGTCNTRKGAVSISGAQTNAGTTSCLSNSQFSYNVLLTAGSGAKTLSLKQSGKGGGTFSVTYNYTEVVVQPPTPTPTPTPTPSPTPAPMPTEPTLQFGLHQAVSIPTNFDISGLIVDYGGPAASADPDTVGAFRFICAPAHVSYDDPIVYPGQPGAAHLHQFFGNTMTNAHSTYESLRTSGDSTCNNALNRSAYWMPAMMNGKGGVVRPDYVVIYYKRYPQTSPDCLIQGKGCVDLPRGLRMIFGANGSDPGSIYYNCDGPTATPGHYPNIVEAAKNCPIGNRLGALLSAPNCWNGQLDSADHRSHLAYGSYGYWGYYKCPDTHPWVIPSFSLGAWYTTDADLDRSGVWDPIDTSKQPSTWTLSSDHTHAPYSTMMPGTSLHSDWFGAWDDNVLRRWHDACIDKKLNCSAGNLGDGYGLQMFPGFTWEANPRVVPVPLKPVAQ